MSKPSSDLVGDPDNWDASQRRQWLKLLGVALEENYSANGHVDLSETIYQLAETIVGAPGPKADSLGNLLSDETNDIFYDLHQIVVWFQYTEGFGGFAGISTLDLGTDKIFVFELPVEHLGTDLQIRGVVDRDDLNGIVEAANDLLERAWVPNEISVSDPITRDDVFKAYTRGHDAMHMWDNLATMMRKWGHNYPAETASEKEDLLNAYLDIALRDE